MRFKKYEKAGRSFDRGLGKLFKGIGKAGRGLLKSRHRRPTYRIYRVRVYRRPQRSYGCRPLGVATLVIATIIVIAAMIAVM